MLANHNITEHFTYKDCRCPCCAGLYINDLLYSHMDELESLRLKAEFPILINSGHRCRMHNESIGGAELSWHKKFATDIRPAVEKGDLQGDFDRKMRILYNISRKLKFGGIGKATSFIHLDMRPDGIEWTY